MTLDATPRALRRRSVVRAGTISLAASVVILCVKLSAWWLTGSTALLADALESVVNVIAAAVLTLSVIVAARPADEDHPYGHGKAESLSAALEGSLILFAAGAIFIEALHKLSEGPSVERVGAGLALGVAAGVANLALGAYLVRTGRQQGSEALEADGRHVLTDVYTTAGSVGALLGILATGWMWLDPLAGIVLALHIVRTGWQVVRRALSGLLDEADFGSLHDLADALEAARQDDWIDVHQLRTRRAGPLRHIDLHLVVPRYYTIERAHVIGDEMERVLVETIGEEGDVVVHVDPCRPWHCAQCAIQSCPVRSEALEKRPTFEVTRITRMGSV